VYRLAVGDDYVFEWKLEKLARCGQGPFLIPRGGTDPEHTPGAVRASAKTKAHCSGNQMGVSSRPRPS